jgi:hypothetical protein
MRTSHPSPLLAVAVLVTAVAAGGAATHAAAADTPSSSSAPTSVFGAHPVEQGRTTLPGGHFNFALLAGGHISDAVVVENFTDHAIGFHIYGADLRSTSGGALAPAQPTDTMHAAGAWIVISQPQVTIPAHGQLTDAFTLTLPETVSPGQHLGAVVASANLGTTPQGSVIEARVALIVVVTVPGRARVSAALGPLRGSTAVPSHIRFTIALSNTGNVLLSYVGSVAVYNDRGDEVARLPLIPTDAYVVPTGHVPLAADWNATIPQSGTYRAQVTVTILADGKPVETLRSRSLSMPLASGRPAPLVITITLGCGLILIFMAVFIARRMHTRRRLGLLRDRAFV